MELLEISDKRRMSREEAAKLMHRIADSLARHNGLDLEQEGKKLRVNVPDQVDVEFEVELEQGENSIEIEISW